MQRFVEHLFVARPLPKRQRQVGFAGFAVPKLRLQVFERTAFFGDQQDAAGFAVQAVHQFQERRLRPGHAQLLNHAKTHARAAMHRHARRFVDGQQVRIFKQDRKVLGRHVF